MRLPRIIIKGVCMKIWSRPNSASLYHLWLKLHCLPLGKWFVSRFLGFYVPYSGSIGANLVQLEPGYAKLMLKDKRKLRNHLNSIHAIALMNLGEMASGLALNLGLPVTVRGIVTNICIEYEKKARGTLIAECRCVIPQVTQDMEFIVHSVIRDMTQEVVANTHVRWRLGLRNNV